MRPVSVFTGTGGGVRGADVVVAALTVWVAIAGAAVEGAAREVCSGGEAGLAACPACASGRAPADWAPEVWPRAMPAMNSGNRSNKTACPRARIKYAPFALCEDEDSARQNLSAVLPFPEL